MAEPMTAGMATAIHSDGRFTKPAAASPPATDVSTMSTDHSIRNVLRGRSPGARGVIFYPRGFARLLW